jgi:PhzF family phenazine biosynthesis protein
MLRQWTVDAFAAAPFRGNPACVVDPFEAWPADAWMQALAAENNQAETAFLLRTPDPARFGLRWFTPALEVPLCGHATLASGHVLLSELGLPAEAIVFDTRSGPLGVARAEAGYVMDFPSQPPRRIETPSGLTAALGAEPAEVWVSTYLVALFEDEETVRTLSPDVRLLEAASADVTLGRGNVGVAALARAGSACDVVDRFFAPGSGIPEDPTTGSLHCILTPLFADRLGRGTIRFHQAYPGRGGDLVCEARGARVGIGGQAVTVLESRLRFGPPA